VNITLKSTDYRTKRKTWGDYFKNLKNPTESTKAFFLKVKVMSGIEGIPDEEFLQMDECTHSKKEPPMEYVQ